MSSFNSTQLAFSYGCISHLRQQYFSVLVKYPHPTCARMHECTDTCTRMHTQRGVFGMLVHVIVLSVLSWKGEEGKCPPPLPGLWHSFLSSPMLGVGHKSIWYNKSKWGGSRLHQQLSICRWVGQTNDQIGLGTLVPSMLPRIPLMLELSKEEI